MTKNQLILASLVAAVPGAVLAILAVVAFLKYSGGWSFLVQGVTVLALLAGATLALMPVGVQLFAGPRAEKAEKKEAAAPASESSAAVAEVAEEGSHEASGFTAEQPVVGAETMAEADFNLGTSEVEVFDDEEQPESKKKDEE